MDSNNSLKIKNTSPAGGALGAWERQVAFPRAKSAASGKFFRLMTRRRFHAPPEAFNENSVTLPLEEARHLRDVLRLKAGDEAFVFDGAGKEYLCAVAETGRGNHPALLEVREEVAAPHPESRLNLTLALALLKGEKFDLVVQKATELGVHSIVPVATQRADLRDAQDALKRVARWQRLALEACKQSGRARVPVIESPSAFSSLMESSSPASGEVRLMFAERMGQSLFELTNRPEPRPLSLTALVGPEGGWEDEEILQARQAGWAIVTLGGRTLRAETAGITAVVLLQHLYGDLR